MMRLAFPLLFVVLLTGWCSEWTQFRGPNGSGVSGAKGLPVEFGPAKNVLWKTALPAGHSTPVFTPDRIFLTGFDSEGKLWTFCLNREDGKVLWRREAPRPRRQELHKSNSPASPSAVTDGRNAYVFFTDFGLLSYGPDGEERWRMPLGPFNNPFGMGASPVLAGNTLLQICDSESGSFFAAYDKDTGKLKWRVERPDVARGFSTPVLYQPKDGEQQVIVPGSYRLVAYSVATGERLWWTSGLTWQLKPTPVMDGERIYVLGWAGGSDTGQQEEIAPFDDVLKTWDANKDGVLAKAEVPDLKILKDWSSVDLDRDDLLGSRDWQMYRDRRAAQNGLTAFRLGGRGDMTGKSIVWRYTKSLPNVPSPLLYDGVIYLAKEGGLFTSIDPANGEVLKQGRLQGALDQYFASPVAADGRVYVASQSGHVVVLKAGAQWEVLGVNTFDDEIHSTPVPLGNRLYIRTRSALYALGTP
ncbi:MAG: PQQ-binding-like beta-propeller repeat protein [Bryobacteraceae bacterium]|nr:PQQ-binding-like beta-propeller repeat protein [Bryobacteraceae bacterium]